MTCPASLRPRGGSRSIRKTVEHEEELVVGGMFVPMILALHHAEANDRFIHPDERLVVPYPGPRPRADQSDFLRAPQSTFKMRRIGNDSAAAGVSSAMETQSKFPGRCAIDRRDRETMLTNVDAQTAPGTRGVFIRSTL